MAFLVVTAHTKGYDPDAFIDVATVAISVFFFISGFLMPLTFECNYQFEGFWVRTKHYVINRILRVYPLYWVSLCLVLVHGIIRQTNPDVTSVLATTTALTQNFLLIGMNQSPWWGGQYVRLNNPAWTLDVEFQYYLLVPLLIWGWSRRRWIIVAMLAMCSMGSLYLLSVPAEKIFIDRSLLAWGALFAAGFLLYQFVRASHNPVGVRVSSYWGLAVGGLSVSASSIFLHDSLRLVAATVGLMMFAGYLLIAQKARMFARFDRQLGNLSYPVYIFHYPVIHIAQAKVSQYVVDRLASEGGSQFTLRMCANITFSTVVAWFFLRTVDRPVQNLRAQYRMAST